MKAAMKHLIILICCFVTMDKVAGQNILHDTVRVEAILKAGRDSIGSVLKRITCEKLEQIGFINRYASTLKLEERFSYSGINYIYLFDLILSYPEKIKFDERDTIATSTSFKQKYQFYGKCILYKKESPRFIKLMCKDVAYLQKYLSEWWSMNEKLSFEEIQNCWIKQEPLLRAGYVWF